MIVVDTNVVSEPLRRRPDARVVNWLDEQVVETLFLTSITVAELLAGVEVLPSGKRRDALRENLHGMLSAFFHGRILAFGEPEAVMFAEITAKAKARGAALSFADAQIAAIAKVRSFAVATRDESPFHAAGLTVINPWLSEE